MMKTYYLQKGKLNFQMLSNGPVIMQLVKGLRQN